MFDKHLFCGQPFCVVAPDEVFFSVVDNDKEKPMARGRICILTKKMKKIEEQIIVVINGCRYEIKVHETTSWAPTFIRSDTDDDDDDDDESEDEDMVLEDGEITEKLKEIKQADHPGLENAIKDEIFGLEEIIRAKHAEIKESVYEPPSDQESSLSTHPGFYSYQEILTRLLRIIGTWIKEIIMVTRLLKSTLKVWNSRYKLKEKGFKIEIEKRLHEIDILTEEGDGLSSLLGERKRFWVEL
ncbi:hypothetical protein L1987_65062 [Smallanthus sonchifolius]|uniref:Uncharacterized protein n=1 Tax=Smallanthus sonchifolius TaxID=185202 RepID=A0ACB9BTF6_9ASTR|nr:hypothetical protein L1987_65062 [Smallanthus sonchifolius]